MKQSEIKLLVTLDADKVPEKLEWEATDSGMEGRRACHASMMTIWDPADRTTLRIDLWTKEMMVDDMKRFFYESLSTMAETYQRATNDKDLSKEIKDFAEQFARKAGL